jgi:predicted DNA-binding helix-hairpin-helix protein
MNALERLRLLTGQMHLEPAEDTGCSKIASSRDLAGMVHNAVMLGGKHIALLKTLLTSACERNCNYCPFRAGRDFQRVTLKPEEMANTFISMQKSGVVEGIFLSSGLFGGGIHTQDQLIDTAEILRTKLGFTGYLHLKIMPGAERAQVERSMQLADRVSINLEAPNSSRLEMLAPRKNFFQELMQPLQWIEQIRRTRPAHQGWNGHWPSSVTQFVAGGAGESDLELLSTTNYLYRQLHLRRAYFSAFNPIPDTPLENQPPVSAQREHRLYQSSFLLRDYGFDLEELPFDPGGNLPMTSDPKLAWAQANLTENPVDINRADRQQLLRIPGIGPLLANSILSTRRTVNILDINALRKLGISVNRAAPFILLNGKRPTFQSTFW